MQSAKKSQRGPTRVIAATLAICAAPGALKLAGAISAPWWLATLPLWAAPALIVAFGLVMAVVTVLVAIADDKAERR